MTVPRYFATIATGSPAQAAHLLANGFALKDARLTRRGVVVFKFSGTAINALESYRRAHSEIRARMERAHQETPNGPQK